MELLAQPAALPTILSALTNDASTLEASDDWRYQLALANALADPSESPPIQTAVQSHAAVATTPQHAPDDEPPDWLSLRRPGQEEVRHD
jgi:hypothetical protein